jgi:chemotaxis methyl-accepting protein methylase
VVGAATGEEAYTLALLLAEACARDRGNGFEVIASDLDSRSLEVARAGIYPREVLASVPPQLHSRYFRPEGSGVRVADGIRDRVHFARHDLVGPQLAPREAIVASSDLVLCRNVLLYFDPSLRAKALARLAAVLEPGGALMIGSSETLPPQSERDFALHPGVSAGSAIFVRREN